jgi:hypothetical protein
MIGNFVESVKYIFSGKKENPTLKRCPDSDDEKENKNNNSVDMDMVDGDYTESDMQVDILNGMNSDIVMGAQKKGGRKRGARKSPA